MDSWHIYPSSNLALDVLPQVEAFYKFDPNASVAIRGYSIDVDGEKDAMVYATDAEQASLLPAYGWAIVSAHDWLEETRKFWFNK